MYLPGGNNLASGPPLMVTETYIRELFEMCELALADRLQLVGEQPMVT